MQMEAIAGLPRIQSSTITAALQARSPLHRNLTGKLTQPNLCVPMAMAGVSKGQSYGGLYCPQKDTLLRQSVLA